MPIKIIRRGDTGGLTLSGTVAGHRIRQRAASDDPKLAKEEAAVIEAQILRSQWHGERRGYRRFSEAVALYLETPRSANTNARLTRLLDAVGNPALGEIDQNTVDQVRRKMLRPDVKPATVMREIVDPLSAILTHAWRRGWCEPPNFERTKPSVGRTRYFRPAEALKLIEAAAPHLKPLLIFLFSTGARLSEAIELDWRDVDLLGGRAILWKTKTGHRRNVALPIGAIRALAAIPLPRGAEARSGPVFRWQPQRSAKRPNSPRNQPRAYADRERRSGGHIVTAWKGALRRAGLDPGFTPHDCRHSWASWHYAVNKDLLLLKQDGGWKTASQVERYAHLMPAGETGAIRAFWEGREVETPAARLMA